MFTPFVSCLVFAMFVLSSADPQTTCAVPSNRKNSLYLGAKLILTKPSKVEATFCSPNSNFKTDVYANGPNVSGPQQVLIGNTKTTAAGSKLNVGAYQDGTELIFSIQIVGDVPIISKLVNQGKTWYSGPSDRNADNKAHASIIDQGNGIYWVGFEDTNQCNVLCLLTRDQDYDDASFSLKVTELPPCANGVWRDVFTDNPVCECKPGFEANALWAGVPGSDGNKCLAKCGWDFRSYQSGEGVCECVW